MWRLYVTFLFLGFFSGVYMKSCPAREDIQCDCEREFSDEITVTCYSSESLKQALEILSGKSGVRLKLSQISLGKLPSNFFQGVGITYLQLDHCDFDSFSEDDQPGLLGLEDTLEKLEIFRSFMEKNMPAKLNLGHLNKLKVLDLFYNDIEELGDDWFSNGPASLEILLISGNGIKKIGKNAFSQLTNLKQIELEDNRFGEIERSMFPATANQLKFLILKNNSLSDLPSDIFSEMPSISSIDLYRNEISTLEEETWSPIWQQLRRLNLDENNVNCDERLKWITKHYKRPRISGYCATPWAWKDDDLTDFIKSLD